LFEGIVCTRTSMINFGVLDLDARFIKWTLLDTKIRECYLVGNEKGRIYCVSLSTKKNWYLCARYTK